MKSLAVPISIAFIVAGCLLGTGHDISAASSMSIQIVKPVGSISVPVNGKISLTVKITGMTLDPGRIGGRNVPNHGHYHFYIDCIPPEAYTQVVMSRCLAAVSVSTPTTVFDLSRSLAKVGVGTHVLLVALAQNNHVLYRAPPTTMLFTVIRPQMSVRIISPQGPVTVARNGKIQMHLQVTGMTLAPRAMGRKSVPGEGHFHFYVDCIPPGAYTSVVMSRCLGTASAGGVFDLSRSTVKITTGPHLLLVALAQNNHVLYQAAAATLVFDVRQGPSPSPTHSTYP